MRRARLAMMVFAIMSPVQAVAQNALDDNPTDLQKFDEWSSWQKVLDKAEIGQEAREYQRRLTEIGVVAAVHSCRFVSQIARGVTSGAVATGGLCSISISRKAKRDFWVCENNIGSFNISDVEEYGLNYETSKEFIGNTCWRF